MRYVYQLSDEITEAITESMKKNGYTTDQISDCLNSKTTDISDLLESVNMLEWYRRKINEKGADNMNEYKQAIFNKFADMLVEQLSDIKDNGLEGVAEYVLTEVTTTVFCFGELTELSFVEMGDYIESVTGISYADIKRYEFDATT